MDNDVKSWIIRVKDKKDDYEAWDRLYLRYKGFLISIIRRYVFDLDLQQDMIQEIWLKVFRNIKSYDENRYFEAWLHVVARNVCISWLQINKEKIKCEIEIEECFDGDIEQSHNHRDFVNEICDRDAIKQALESIKDKKYVLAFKYKFIDGLTLQQIAKIFSKPENVVKNWIYREVVYKIRPLIHKSIGTKSK